MSGEHCVPLLVAASSAKLSLHAFDEALKVKPYIEPLTTFKFCRRLATRQDKILETKQCFALSG